MYSATWNIVGIASLYCLLLATVAAQDSCTLDTNFKDEDFPCRKLLHCREPNDWTSLRAEIKTRSEDDRLCAIVVDCANMVSISNFDFQAIGGVFDRVINITISRCNTTQVRLADDMYYVVEVDLKGNSFDSLDFMQDWPKADMEFLHFSNNQIGYVSKTDFSGMLHLNNLRLDSNLISDIEPGSFQDNHRLQVVDLANNHLETLKEYTFQDLNGLKCIRVSGNSIKNLTSSAFVNVHTDSLDLSHNDVMTVPNSTFVDTSVISLNLSNCRIGNIPFGFLSSLRQNLTTLDLSNNDIGSLISDAFVQLSQLNVIYLNGNRLTTIEQTMFPPSISEIHLTSKNFRCCHLLWLQTSIKGSGGIGCIYPFDARLSQYLNSSFDCAEPEVFSITTNELNATAMLATCVARGAPAPNVTLVTYDGSYLADAVCGTPGNVNPIVSVQLMLPVTDVHKYRLVCTAVSTEGTHQVSLDLNATELSAKTITATTTTSASTAAAAAAAATTTTTTTSSSSTTEAAAHASSSTFAGAAATTEAAAAVAAATTTTITTTTLHSCTLDTNFKDNDFPCRKLLHCREPNDWTSLSAEIKRRSQVDRLCAIVVDCANTVSISNFDFQAIGGDFDRVVNITISRCDTTQVRLADDMYYVVEVDLNGNGFDSLDFMQDWSVEDMETLHFPNNQIGSVKKTYFSGMIHLSNIRLDSNLIKYVEPDSFRENQRLQTVDLANNRLLSLGENMLRDLKGLKVVRMAGNRINSLEAASFGNVHLDSLDLSHNDVTTVPNSAFVDTSIISLNLSNCRIVNIPSGFLSSLRQNLTTLDLSNNYIERLPSNAFVHLSHLQVIYLTGNRITTIEQSMFPPSISGIHVTSNSLRCCHLLWLQTLMEGTPSGDGVECVYPFAARLSQYLNSSFHCADPKVLSITTNYFNATSTQATCVVRGVPPPKVTLMTNDRAFVADAVGGTPGSVNPNVSVSLLLPNIDVFVYHLICFAVNAKGTHLVSRLSFVTSRPAAYRPRTPTPPGATTVPFPFPFTTEYPKRSHYVPLKILMIIFACVWIVVVAVVVLVFCRYRLHRKRHYRISDIPSNNEDSTSVRDNVIAGLELVSPPGYIGARGNVGFNSSDNMAITTLSATSPNGYRLPRGTPPPYTSLPDVNETTGAWEYDFARLDTMGDDDDLKMSNAHGGSQTGLVTSEHVTAVRRHEQTDFEREFGGNSSRVRRYQMLEPLAK